MTKGKRQYWKNPERARAIARESYARHRAARQAKQREYYRTKRRMYRYGVTDAEYQAMLQRQNGLCAICGKTQTRQLCLDHDHETGQVRGLLCDRCNRALGV